MCVKQMIIAKMERRQNCVRLIIRGLSDSMSSSKWSISEGLEGKEVA